MTVLDAPPAVPLLALTEPLPGFPDHRRYVLVPARTYFPDYAPALPRAVRGELALDDEEEATLYCLVTVPAGDARAATANLRAPLVVNPARGSARQVVLPDAAHPIRRLLRR